MVDKPASFHSLALEITSHAIKGAQVSLRKGKPCLDRLFEISFNPLEPHSFPNSEQGKDLIGAIPKNLVVTMLNANEVLVRQLEVKLKKQGDIDAVLEFQSEPLLPYPVDNAIIDRQMLTPTQDGTLLTLLAARKDHVQHHLEQWKNLNIDPEVISCTPAALAAFAHLFAVSTAPQFVVHLGQTSTICLLVKEGKVMAAQTIPQGVGQVLAAYNKDVEHQTKSFPLETLDFASVKKEAFPILFETLEGLRLEITRTLYAISKQVKGQEIENIVVTGEGDGLINIYPALCQQLNKPILAPKSAPGFDLSPSQLQRFAPVIGAALTALSGSTNEIDFRQKDFVYPNPWKRYKKPLAIYLALAAALAAACIFFSNAYLKSKEDKLRLQFSELLQFMHKPYNAFDNEYEAKVAGKTTVEEKEATPIKALSIEDIQGRLQYLQKQLKEIPDTYPLLPNVPTVSDVLAWLSTHPNVVGKESKTNDKIPLLQIENFSYSLVKRPEVTKKQEHYQVKVEIEFSSPTPKLAREFHDALIAPNNMVDPKGEVKWSTNRGLYKASFFLKDKTAYPPS